MSDVNKYGEAGIPASRFTTGIIHDGHNLSNEELDNVLKRYGLNRMIFEEAMQGNYELKDAIFSQCRFSEINK